MPTWKKSIKLQTKCWIVIIQMVERENITEVLIASNQVEWVRRMNSIRNSAVEVVMNDLIYV